MGGTIDGYVRYTLEWPFGEDVALGLSPSASPTRPDVWHALWDLVGTSSSIAPETEVVGPLEHTLLFSLPEQEHVTFVREWRWMARIVDLPGAIAARGYPVGLRGSVDLRVHDPQCDWNDGRFRVVVEDGDARLERGGNGDIEIAIGPLSALYTGYATTAMLTTAGLLRTSERGAARVLDAAFSGPAPWMPDFY